MLALAILVVVFGVTYFTFSTVAIAWRRGTALTDGLHHADFVLEQLAMALRSAYYPDAGISPDYGFRLEDNGDGEHSSDVISWVKLGHSLVGKDCPFAGAPHRVEFAVVDGDKGERVAAVRAWRLLGQVEDFESDDVEPEFISRGVRGFNCRPLDPQSDPREEEIEWLEEWEDTNRVPTSVELTLYMDPLAEGEDAVEIKRIVEIPVALLSWPRRRSSSRKAADSKQSQGAEASRGSKSSSGSQPSSGSRPASGSQPSSGGNQRVIKVSPTPK
jgi:hypothetical protein